jgi:hypothetical protein
MSNILIKPDTGSIYFDESTAGGSSVPDLTSNSISLNYAPADGLNIISFDPVQNQRFSIDGNGGRLFGVSDNASSVNFSVNNLSGLPLIEATSNSGVDDKIILGQYGANVGIGTNSPDELLHLNATSISGREVLFKGTVSDAGNDQFGISNGTALNNNFGPSFYGYKDSDYGNGYIYSMNFRGMIPTSQDLTNSNVFGIVNFETFTTTNPTDPNNGTLSAVSNRQLFTFRNAGTTLLQIDADGDVGIGTTTPSEKLDVNGAIKATDYKSSDGSVGADGSFTTVDGKTVTVKNGLITNIA